MQEQKYRQTHCVITYAYIVLNYIRNVTYKLDIVNRKSYLSPSFCPSFFPFPAPMPAGKYKLERMY